MPSSEFMEWMVFDEVEPIGDRRGDVQAGIIASSYFNAMQNKKTFSPLDFMPFKDDPPAPKVQSVEEQMIAWNAIMLAQNASCGNA